MILSDICIRRPVLATVLNIMVVLLGLVAYDRLTVREYPNIDEPVVTVSTSYPGASAEIIESQITKPLEDSLSGIEGIEVLSSVSRAERSQISVRFKLTRDPDVAASDVRDRVGRARGRLPDEVDEPVIAKVEADAQPIMYLAFSSPHHNPMEISDYADRYVKDRLQNILGVSEVRIFGERRISMRIWLDPQKLAGLGVTVQDVERALRAQNVEIPAGRIESLNREFTVLSETDLKTPLQFENVVIKNTGDRFIHLRDLGRAEVAPEDERRTTRFNGDEAVALGVVKQATSNPLDVSKAVREMLPQIEQELPDGMELNVAYDSSIFIEKSISGVYHTIAEAMVLVVLVIFFFLRSIRSSIIPMLTIPISLIGAFMIMFLMGFTINTLTLLAMVLAIGLVVDDAIVMLENIYRHIEEGYSPKEAALMGSREIAFAVIAMTITLAAVYAPVAFIEGRTGRLFTEFALTLAGAVIISGYIALTLTPMLCAQLLRPEGEHGKIYQGIEKILNGLQNGYQRSLNWALDYRKTVLLLGLVSALSSVLFLNLLKSELAPIEDRGTILVIGSAPEGSTIDYTTNWMQQMEPIFAEIPEVSTYFVIAGFPTVSQGRSFLRLDQWEDRGRKQQDIVSELQPKLFGSLPGILAFPVNPPSLGRGASSKPVEMVIQTTGSYEELNSVLEEIINASRDYPGLAGVETDLKLNTPQLTLDIDRNKALASGIGIDTIGRTLETLFGGRQVTRFKQEGEQYDVILKMAGKDRSRPDDISNVYVQGLNNTPVQLSNLLTVSETIAPKELNHFNQLRAAKITASVPAGSSLSEALTWLQQTAREYIQPNMLIDYDGESREFFESSSSLAMTFGLALIFIFLVLAAQFESWISPFMIMLTVPLSMAGALLLLYITGGTLNIYSQIGLITLIGLITKNGILIVEFANQQREKGRAVMEAIRRAATLRLRPILMTSGSVILGALPLAIATGAGAESRSQIGWVVIGGMTIGTLFTLYVIPVVYSYVGGRVRVEEIESQKL